MLAHAVTVALASVLLLGGCHDRSTADNAAAPAAAPSATPAMKGWAGFFALPDQAIKALNAQGFAFPAYANSQDSFRSVAPPATLTPASGSAANVGRYQLYGSAHQLDGARFALEIVDPAGANAALGKFADQITATLDKLGLPGGREIADPIRQARTMETAVKDASITVVRYPHEDKNPQHFRLNVDFYRVGVYAPIPKGNG